MVLTPGRRALLYGIIGFSVVAVPAAGLGIPMFRSPGNSELPGLGMLLGKITISAGVIVGLIVGAISAAIGGGIHRK